jgi:hypothetical protein
MKKETEFSLRNVVFYRKYGMRGNVQNCRVFQKELYNFESLCKFIQRTGTVF